MDIVRQYFPELNDEKLKKLEALFDVYDKWNDKINVISRKDFQNFYINHLLYSLTILKFFKFKNQTTFLDVGTGGGFPGVPLAICLDNCKFTLTDSIAKKIKVVNEVVTELNIKNVNAVNLRAEQIENKFDFVIGRAVIALPQFVSLVSDKISKNNRNDFKNGILYLKGGDFQNEIAQIKRKAKVIDLYSAFPLEFFETKKIVYLHQ